MEPWTKTGAMPTWRRPYPLRGLTAKTAVLTCALILLLYHARSSPFHYQPLAPAPSLSSGSVPTPPASTAAPPATPSPSPAPGPEKEDDEPPRKIWYKLGPKGLSEAARGWTDTCIAQNPGYAVEFLTDATADALVNARFADRPDLLEVYNALAVPILKADLLRYLLLYAEGGVWFDLDASCAGVAIDAWVPPALAGRAALVVGWEFDGGYHFEFDRQFVTWAVLARRRRVAHLLAVAEDIAAALRTLAAAHGVPLAGLRMPMVADVVDATGPRRFAASVLRHLGATHNLTAPWDAYHELLEPKLAGDVLILPGYALAASYNTYEPEDQHRVGPPLVVHHYAGSWKNAYGGEKADEGEADDEVEADEP